MNESSFECFSGLEANGTDETETAVASSDGAGIAGSMVDPLAVRGRPVLSATEVEDFASENRVGLGAGVEALLARAGVEATLSFLA